MLVEEVKEEKRARFKASVSMRFISDYSYIR